MGPRRGTARPPPRAVLSDAHAIPFVTYEGDEARPDFEYGYADALADRRVVRPVYFPSIDGLSHREVNSRLNRLASVTRIADATVDQLRRRAHHAERWMASL